MFAVLMALYIVSFVREHGTEGSLVSFASEDR